MTTKTARPTRLATAPDTEETVASFAPPSQPPAVRENTEQQPAVRQSVALPKTDFGEVIAAIAGVMAEIRPVEKLGWNKFQNYAHARIGDLNAELTPLMGKHGLVVFQNEVDRTMFDGGSTVSVRYEFTVVHKSGQIWPERPLVTGMSRCRDSKGGFDDKTFNKCHTAARKYFLISLFQIPVEDANDADDHEPGGGEQRQPSERPRPTRRPPSPDGKATPGVVPIVDGEAPTAWAERFKKACGEADSLATIQKWYDANVAIFDKIKKFKDDKIDGQAIYDGLIDFMDALEVKLTGGGKEATEEKAPPKEAHQKRQRRAPAPPPVEEPQEPEEGADASDETALWLESLENAYGACEDAEALGEAQAKHMTPKKGEVSQEAWADAVKITRKHLARMTGGE